jgi:hypothetical protein
MLLTKPLCRSEVGVLETKHAVKVEALQALLLEVRIYVSSYYYICVLVSHIWACCQSWGPSDAPARGSTYYILHILNMCPHNTICILQICPPTTIYAVKVEALQAFLILLYMCPHTTTFVSSYYYTCDLMLLYIASQSWKGGSAAGHTVKKVETSSIIVVFTWREWLF